jgi:PAS domain S-box-containing protein
MGIKNYRDGVGAMKKIIELNAFIKGIINNIITSGLYEHVDEEILHKIKIINWLSIFGIFNLGIITLTVFREGFILLGFFDLTIMLVLVFNLLYLRRGNRLDFMSHFAVGLIGLLFFYLFITGGVNSTGYLWYYTFPFFALFLLGASRGAFVTIVLLMITTAFLVLDKYWPFLTIYSTDFKIRFIGSFLVVFMNSYLFEIVREETHQKLITRNAGLEQIINNLRDTEIALRESEEKFRNVVERASDGIALIYDSKLKYVNPMLAELIDVPVDSMIDTSLIDYIYPGELSKFQKYLKKKSAGENLRSVYQTALKSNSGHRVDVEINTETISINGEHRELVIIRNITQRKLAQDVLRTAHDELEKRVQERTLQLEKSNKALQAEINERIQAEEKLQNSEAFLNAIVENIPNMIFVKDAKKLRFVRLNKAGEELLGYSQKELIGRSDFDFFPENEATFYTAKDREVLASGQLLDISEEPITTKQKVRRILHTKKIPLYNGDGRPAYLLGISEDITEKKRTEEALRESEERFRLLYENAPIGIFRSTYEGEIMMANPALIHMLGYDSVDELTNVENATALYAPGFGRDDFLKEIEKDGVVKAYECVLKKKSDDIIFIREYAKAFKDKNGKISYFEGTVEDITEQKLSETKLRESEMKFRSVIESANDAIILANSEGNIISWNKAAQIIFGYKEEEILLKPIKSLICEEKNKQTTHISGNTPATGKYQILGKKAELLGLKKDETKFPIELSLALGKTGKGIFYNYIIRDVSERRKVEDQIRASLNEKEVLLKEIHHRVKNNLQIISSLLYLQSKKINDEKALGLFIESQNRVKSMALVHEKLYQSRDLALVNFAQYIRDLVNHLVYSYNKTETSINLKLEVQDVSLSINTAIPCGLIINELVSNSMKYAFPNGSPKQDHHTKHDNEIKIVLSLNENGENSLIVSDNGKGFPENVNFKETSSLGLQLVNSLVDQIDGSIELDRQVGTIFKIIFGNETLNTEVH